MRRKGVEVGEGGCKGRMLNKCLGKFRSGRAAGILRVISSKLPT